MTLTRLFTTTFDPFLKEQGFVRKGRVYSRLKGEILQGVVIKPINPYSIHCFARPYWLPLHGESWSSLTKGYWAEMGDFDIDTSIYYRQENEELNARVMNFCLDLVKNMFLPILDRIVDIDSYLESRNRYTDYYEPWRGGPYPVIEYPRSLFIPDAECGHTSELRTRISSFSDSDDQYAYLYKAYLDGDFGPAYKLFERDVLSYVIKKHSEYSEAEVQKWLHYYSHDFFEKMENNDLEWIKRHKDERREMLLPRLRDELKLNTFDL